MPGKWQSWEKPGSRPPRYLLPFIFYFCPSNVFITAVEYFCKTFQNFKYLNLCYVCWSDPVLTSNVEKCHLEDEILLSFNSNSTITTLSEEVKKQLDMRECVVCPICVLYSPFHPMSCSTSLSSFSSTYSSISTYSCSSTYSSSFTYSSTSTYSFSSTYASTSTYPFSFTYSSTSKYKSNLCSLFHPPSPLWAGATAFQEWIIPTRWVDFDLDATPISR